MNYKSFVIVGSNSASVSDGKERFIDEHQPLTALGVDSMSIVQFKGVVEKKFHCELPDEFCFSAYCNLHELAISVHEGKMTAEQKQKFGFGEEGAGAGHGDAGGNKGGNKGKGKGVEMVGGEKMPGQPLCPWFTCCY